MNKIILIGSMKYVKSKEKEIWFCLREEDKIHTPSKRNSVSFSDSHIVILEANASTIAKKNEREIFS